MHLVFSGMFNSSFELKLVTLSLLFIHFVLFSNSRIDTENDTASTFGKVSEEKNKFQGGILLNDTIYAIPSNAENILCIDTHKSGEGKDSSDYVNNYSLLGNLPPTKDKWQGKDKKDHYFNLLTLFGFSGSLLTLNFNTRWVCWI